MIPYNNDYLYTCVELQRQFVEPFRVFAEINRDVHNNFFSGSRYGRTVAAWHELFERITRHYAKPEFNIGHTIIGDKKFKVKERKVLEKTFCNLIHFSKEGNFHQPKLLIVAPMSGHHATLLRGTVEGFLPHFDVYITDWIDAREVPVEKGYFRFDDFVNYVLEFIRELGKGVSVLAVCQPSVPVLAAVSLMAAENDKDVPSSMVLMGGPIDTRKNPTEVNDYAAERTILWFESNVITKVPYNYAGAMRSVYPGFMQLFGFMAMNMQNHIQEHWKLFNHLVEGDGESAEAHKKFYNEYLSVMDLPAEFFLDTVNIVFKEHLLPRGKLVCNGKKVNPSLIKNTSLLCIEGEKDDISGIGQTKAAMGLCDNLADSKKKYHLQKEVGHYGIFNGRRFREQVVPLVTEFAYKASGFKGTGELPSDVKIRGVAQAAARQLNLTLTTKFGEETMVLAKKKTATKKTVAKKKPAAKKTTVKKAVKKTTVKKAVKKPAVKKAVKKPAAKRKTTAAKK